MPVLISRIVRCVGDASPLLDDAYHAPLRPYDPSVVVRSLNRRRQDGDGGPGTVVGGKQARQSISCEKWYVAREQQQRALARG